MRTKQIYFIAEIAVFSALGVALDFACGLLFGFAWLNGGSISIAMVPILMMGFRWGIKGGLATGLSVGIIQLLIPTLAYTGGGPIQVFLDYIFAYGVIGMVGALNLKKMTLNNQVIYGTLAMGIVGLLRTTSHVISGVVFFGTTWWGSIIYNILYMIPSIFISGFIVDLLIVKTPQLIFFDEY